MQTASESSFWSDDDDEFGDMMQDGDADFDVSVDGDQKKSGPGQQQEKMQKVGVDLEKFGPGLEDPVCQVAFAWGTSLAEPIESFSVCIDYKDVPMDADCETKFWSQHQDILRRIEKEALAPAVQWPKINKFVNSWDGKELTYVSDNPNFDCGALDYNLLKTCGRRLPMRYSSTGEYRAIEDPSEQIKGLGKRLEKQIKEMATALAPETHWAEDDARHILVLSFLVDEAIRELDKLDDAAHQKMTMQRRHKRKRTDE